VTRVQLPGLPGSMRMNARRMGTGRESTSNAFGVSKAKEVIAMMADPVIQPRHPLAGRGVYLLDDHEVVRRGLRHLLESDGLSIAGESGSAREAVRRVPALRPALVILDDDLPDGSGADVCRAIARRTQPSGAC
jgi:PleD family two-component response regulator